ncbi:hypothetical protein GPALN_005011 [Globodera pallida]|nr:hypothetical protein GPALN_005011 [Globodera pallida]
MKEKKKETDDRRKEWMEERKKKTDDREKGGKAKNSSSLKITRSAGWKDGNGQREKELNWMEKRKRHEQEEEEEKERRMEEEEKEQ